MRDAPCPFGISNVSSALMPSLPISPHAQPHSTIALHRACSPARIVFVRNAFSSCSLAARCASQACSSDCAAVSFVEVCVLVLLVRVSSDWEAEGCVWGYEGWEEEESG